ncbi:hypothetical protein MMAD_46380 [Mycolicibacterium madagascariense]|uniref:Uncharacterized protein n=1 Tax=Mycolicibacterium madagascariense TaxID=212765 RepID=A0A7I7XMN6_9MYCO|nr:hypothetical protein [Mycolicibacterium madagascariense]MCV7013039.1 hypothetical protein [Mycolicibacterium madagascariense]BBZ30343.1 hypothetical protein MMAD_46380 [Mycolicibacterium madagascariense]
MDVEDDVGASDACGSEGLSDTGIGDGSVAGSDASIGAVAEVVEWSSDEGAASLDEGAVSPARVPWVEVCAPPELLTCVFGVRRPPVPEVVEAEAPGVEVVVDGPTDGCGDVCSPLSPVDVGPASASDSVAAWAIPGAVATAIPTPSDTASAPTRPTYLA